jgi:hypothetical protein
MKVDLPCYSKKFQTSWSKIEYYFKKKISTSKELFEILSDIMDEKQYKKKNSLKSFFKNNPEEEEYFMEYMLPKLQIYILNMKKLFPFDELPDLLINRGNVEEQVLTLTRIQVACLLSAAFFGFLVEQEVKNHEFHNFINLSYIVFFSHEQGINFSNLKGKFDCLMNYFKRICKEEPKGKISIHRKTVNEEDFTKSEKKVTKMKINNNKIIEDFDYHLKGLFSIKIS